MAAAAEVGVHSAVAAVLSQLDGTFILKDVQKKTGLKTFCSEKQCVALLVWTLSLMDT